MSGVIQGCFPQGLPRSPAQAAQPFAGHATPAWAQACIGSHAAAQPQRVQPYAAPPHPGAMQLPQHMVPLPTHGGEPLPPQVRQKMETAFGATFADVRIHITPQAQALGATALTHGSHIHFAPGHYDPHTHSGQQLLGRELAHVVQQRAGRVRNPFGTGVAIVQDRMLEAEAERMAMRAAMAQTPAVQAKAAQPLPVRHDAVPRSQVVQRETPVHVSPPMKVGRNAYHIAAHTAGQRIGSVTVHASRTNAIEITDLGVDAQHRRQGVGGMLISSAIDTGMRLGKSRVTLASRDDGSGHLTRWYKSMGFTEVGRDARGLTRLEAPIAAVRPRIAQARMAAPNAFPSPVIQRAEQLASSSDMDVSDDSVETQLKARIQTEFDLSKSKSTWKGTGVELNMRYESVNCTSDTKEEVNKVGVKHGCHTCCCDLAKEKDQPWIGDHIPPTELYDSVVKELGFDSKVKRVLYPHCDDCAEQQSALVNALNSGKKQASKLNAYELKLVTAGVKYAGVASSGRKVNAQEGLDIQALGGKHGCHSCGTKTPKVKYHADHCPPKEFYTPYMEKILAKLGFPDIKKFEAKPQCPKCSNAQGGNMAALTRLAGIYAKDNNIISYKS